jgi:hypothetical protein
VAARVDHEGSRVSRTEAGRTDGPIPAKMLVPRTGLPIDIPQVQNTVEDVAGARKMVAEPRMPPCRAKGRVRRSGSKAKLMSPVVEAMAPWRRRAILAGVPAAARLHEDTSSDVLQAADGLVLRTNMGLVDCTLLAEAPRDTVSCSMGLCSHPGSCEGSLGWDVAGCLHSSYVLVEEAACRLRLPPWAAWRFACDAKRFRRTEKAGYQIRQSGTAREVTAGLGCDHGSCLA